MLLRQSLNELGNIEQTRVRIENAVSPNGLRATDAERAYEALFLRSFTIFEFYLETLFYRSITGSIKYPKTHLQCRAGMLTRNAANIMVFKQEKYLTWMPYDNTRARAEIWFVGGRPFTLLSDPQRQFLTQATAIRNAIAHSSSHSRSEFLKKVVGNSSVPARDKAPARWLRRKTRIGHSDTYFQVYLSLFGVCMKSLYPPSAAKRELR